MRAACSWQARTKPTKMRTIQNLAVATIAFAATMISGTALADTTLPPVEVTGSRPTLCKGMECEWYLDNWATFMTDSQMEWEAVGLGSMRVNAPDMPNNPVKATCKSDGTTREDHAQQDAKYYNISHPNSPLRAGMIVTVSYDDGGTEEWVASGMSSPLSYSIEGSLQCP